MSAMCGKELKVHNVAVMSLWPGPAKTEYLVNKGSSISTKGNKTMRRLGKRMEINPFILSLLIVTILSSQPLALSESSSLNYEPKIRFGQSHKIPSPNRESWVGGESSCTACLTTNNIRVYKHKETDHIPEFRFFTPTFGKW